MTESSPPDGYHTVTPYLVVSGVEELVEFTKRVFGAQERRVDRRPDSSIAHAEVQVGDSVLMLGEASAEWAPMPSNVHLYVDDTDAVYARAIKAGATSLREPVDEPYGDRMSGVKDASGNMWWIATRIKRSAT
jgi:uncharacterized glyoxalase superfamily protein PhnB